MANVLSRLVRYIDQGEKNANRNMRAEHAGLTYRQQQTKERSARARKRRRRSPVGVTVEPVNTILAPPRTKAAKRRPG